MSANFMGRVLLNIQPFLQATQQARGEWGAFSQDLKDTAAVARGTALALGGMGGVVMNAFRTSLNVFAEFEQGLKNTEVAIGVGSDAMDELREAALRMGNETQITASTATIALGEMAKAGFDAADSIDAAWGAVSLAIATQGDLQTSSKLIASTIRQFTLEADEAARVADIFVNAIFNSPATLESLAAAMKYAGPIARQYGATLTETVVALELLLDTGLRGEQAGTALRNMFIRLVNPTAKTKEIIEGMELTLSQVNPQIVGMYNAVKTLAENNLSAADATTIFGVRAINAYLTISRAVKNPERRLDELRKKMEETGTALAVQEEQLNTFRGSWTLLTSALETTAIRAGEILQKFLRPMVDAFRSLVNSFNMAHPTVQAFVIALTGLTGAAMVTVGALTLMYSRIDDLRMGFAFAIQGINNFTRSLFASVRGIVAWGAAMAANMSQALLRGIGTQVLNLSLLLGRLNPALAGATAGLLGTARALSVLRVVLGALGLYLLVEAFIALRQNSRAFGEVLDAVASTVDYAWRAFGRLLDTLFSADSVIGKFLRTLIGVEGSFEGTNIVVAGFGQVIRGVTGLIVLSTGHIQRLMAALSGFGTLINRGPKAAMDEYREAIEKIDDEMYGRLERIFNPEPIEEFLNRTKNLGPVVDDINTMYDSFGQFSDQTEDYETIMKQIFALDELRDKYEDNADALSLINAEIAKLSDKAEVVESNLAGAEREARRLVVAMRGELGDLQISLIDDDETRKIAEAQQQYREWIEELRKQQEINPYLTSDEVEALILRRQELLQQEITQIQADAQAEREREARSHLDKILGLHERAEARIASLRLGMVADGRVRLRMEYDATLREHERFYAEYIAELEEAGEDTAIAMERQRAERRLIDLRYVEDVMDMYRDFYTQLHNAQAQLDQSAVNVGALTEPERLRRDLDRQLREIRQHYGELRERMAGDEVALTRIVQQEAAARELAQLEYMKAMEDAHRDYSQRRADMRRDIQSDVIALGGDESQKALFDFLGNVNRTISAYETLADEARRYGRDVQSVYDDMHQALLAKEALFQQQMTRINQEANRERLTESLRAATEAIENTSVSQLRALESQLDLLEEAFGDDSRALEAIRSFREQVDTAIGRAVAGQAGRLNEQLDGMSRATLANLRTQVEAWRWAYGDNSAALEAVEGTIAEITSRIERMDEAFQSSLDSIIDSASEFAQSVRGDLTDLNLSEMDRQLMSYLDRAAEASRLMSELRLLLPDATAAQTAAINNAFGVLTRSLEDSARFGVETAERLAREAVEAYNAGLAESSAEASRQGVEAITGLISSSLSQVMNANEGALREARTQLRMLLADLTALGFDSEALEPIRNYISDVDGLVRRYSITLADFASQQFQEVRRVAEVVLEESEARALNIRTLEDEIGLREEALAVTERLAREGSMSASDVLESRRALVASQLEYVDALEEERDALRSNLDAAVAFSEVVQSRLGVQGLSTLEGMRDVLISQVMAMQEAGAAYSEYSGLLAQAEGINTRILDTLTESNERARDELAMMTERYEGQAEAMADLEAANRRQLEFQIESAEVGRQQTALYARLITSMQSTGEAAARQADALGRLVDEQLALGDVDAAIDSQRRLVSLTDARVDAIRDEIRALDARAEAMRQLIRDNEETRRSFGELLDSILEVDRHGLPEEEFDAMDAARERSRLVRQLRDQNLTLDEQMELLREIDELTQSIAESDTQIGMSLQERMVLGGFRRRLEADLAAQDRAAEEQIRLAERASRELQETLVTTLDGLSDAISDLNDMLANLFNTVSGNDVFGSIYAQMLRGASDLPAEMQGLIDSLRETDEVAEAVRLSLSQALDIEQYARDGRMGVEDLLDTLGTFTRVDFGRMGGISGAAFRDGFDDEARELMDNLIGELGRDRVDAALRSWQESEGLPQVGLEMGRPIGEQAVIALMAAIRDGYDPTEFVAHLEGLNEAASASVAASAGELGAMAGREAGRAMIRSMAFSTNAVDIGALLREAMPEDSVIDEGLRIGQGVLDGVMSGVGGGNSSWRNVNQEFSEALTDNLVDPAMDMGREAGTNLMGALISGITSQKDALVGAVRDLLQTIDDYLPHSDARKGPLANLTHSGRMFTRTWGKGALAEKDWLANRVGAALGAALPAVAPSAYSSPIAASVAPGASGGPVVMNVDARREEAAGPVALNARRLVESVERELRMKGIRKP